MATTTELVELESQDQPSRRSSLEVMCDILEVVSSGMGRPTHIIYKANISWRVLNTSLRTLISKGLVSKGNEGKRDVYQLTAKGYSVLHLYKELRSTLLTADRVLTNDFPRDF